MNKGDDVLDEYLTELRMQLFATPPEEVGRAWYLSKRKVAFQKFITGVLLIIFPFLDNFYGTRNDS